MLNLYFAVNLWRCFFFRNFWIRWYTRYTIQFFPVARHGLNSSRPSGSLRYAHVCAGCIGHVWLIYWCRFHTWFSYPPYINFSRGRCLTYIGTEGSSIRHRRTPQQSLSPLHRTPYVRAMLDDPLLIHPWSGSRRCLTKDYVRDLTIDLTNFRQILRCREHQIWPSTRWL
jgi:hypothetical protein